MEKKTMNNIFLPRIINLALFDCFVLTAFIYLLTNDNNFLRHFDDYLIYDKTFGCICICGCDKCEGLFCINHIPTNISFAVGSSCVQKILGERNISILKKIKEDEIFIQCNTPLYF